MCVGSSHFKVRSFDRIPMVGVEYYGELKLNEMKWKTNFLKKKKCKQKFTVFRHINWTDRFGEFCFWILQSERALRFKWQGHQQNVSKCWRRLQYTNRTACLFDPNFQLKPFLVEFYSNFVPLLWLSPAIQMLFFFAKRTSAHTHRFFHRLWTP